MIGILRIVREKNLGVLDLKQTNEFI